MDLASALISSVMLTATRTVHLKNGPWNTNGGYEYNVALIGATLALTEVGAGRPSVDEARRAPDRVRSAAPQYGWQRRCAERGAPKILVPSCAAASLVASPPTPGSRRAPPAAVTS